MQINAQSSLALNPNVNQDLKPSQENTTSADSIKESPKINDGVQTSLSEVALNNAGRIENFQEAIKNIENKLDVSYSADTENFSKETIQSLSGSLTSSQANNVRANVIADLIK